MEEKILYHQGEGPKLLSKTKVTSGKIVIQKKSVRFISEDGEIYLNYKDITSCKLLSHIGGWYVEVRTRKTTINFCVSRVNFANLIIVPNASKTKKVFNEIEEQ